MKRSNLVSRMAVLALLIAGFAQADPPSVVARLGYVSGAASFSPAGQDSWAQATPNRPLVTGDRLWVPDGNRAELQTGSALVRIAGGSQLNLLDIGDRITQLDLVRGTIVVRVPRNDPSRAVEVDTPNVALTMGRAGTYRITVDPADDVTTVIVRDGSAEVFGDNSAYVVRAGEAYDFYGTGLRDFDRLGPVALDEFDAW